LRDSHAGAISITHENGDAQAHTNATSDGDFGSVADCGSLTERDSAQHHAHIQHQSNQRSRFREWE
jgi:hypothetical protein